MLDPPFPQYSESFSDRPFFTVVGLLVPELAKRERNQGVHLLVLVAGEQGTDYLLMLYDLSAGLITEEELGEEGKGERERREQSLVSTLLAASYGFS